ncbi:MAG: serine hydrolase domain-containing protein [Pyrinomonadaceae bacterium]
MPKSKPAARRLVCVTLLLGLIAVAPAAATAQSVDSRLPAEKVARIERAIKALMSRTGAPGFSIAVVTENRLRWQRGYGVADVENSVPAGPSTAYRLASVSKPLTAVAVMQLAEQGKLDLDAPVQKYVPSFPPKQWPVTTRQLLAHTSGIRNYKGDEFHSTRHYQSLSDALAIFKDDPLLHEPGARYTYTTHGYTLLGAIVEGASGMKFTDYAREHVFQPAGMTHTRDDCVADIIPHRARGYAKSATGGLRNADLADTSYKVPGGGLIAPAEDLAKFAIALQTGKLVRPETFALMSKPPKSCDGRETCYGLGWIIGTEAAGGDGGRRQGAIWHNGMQQGVTTNLYLRPKERFALVLLTNMEGQLAELGSLTAQIADIVLKP